MPLETMLRVYFLQNWYALSDPMAEETLYYSEAMHRFSGIELGDDLIPDETTILNFRHLLERQDSTHRPSPIRAFYGTVDLARGSGRECDVLISLHKQATTTPKIRAAIQASTDPAWMVAGRYGISEQTVWKWRKRDSVHDLSHMRHRLQTTLSPAQEAVAVALRTTLLLPLDDLLAVVREFLNPHVSRSGLDRCLRRHGVSNLRELKPKEAKPPHSSFKAYEPGYLHIDIKYLPQMADEDRRR